MSLVFLALCFSHLFRQEKSQRKKLKNSGRPDLNLAQIMLKLVIVLGLTEIIGFIQIPRDNQKESNKIVNSLFAFLYTFLRSLRGVLVFFFYFGNEKVFIAVAPFSSIRKSTMRKNAMRKNGLPMSKTRKNPNATFTVSKNGWKGKTSEDGALHQTGGYLLQITSWFYHKIEV